MEDMFRKAVENPEHFNCEESEAGKSTEDTREKSGFMQKWNTQQAMK